MTNFNFSPEMIKKAQTVANPAELLKMAEEEGIMLTEAQPAQFYKKLQPPMGELEDDELDMVAGGACGNKSTPSKPKDFGFPDGCLVYIPRIMCPRNSVHGFGCEHYRLEWVVLGEVFRLKCSLCGKYSPNEYQGDSKRYGFTKVG